MSPCVAGSPSVPNFPCSSAYSKLVLNSSSSADENVRRIIEPSMSYTKKVPSSIGASSLDRPSQAATVTTPKRATTRLFFTLYATTKRAWAV